MQETPKSLIWLRFTAEPRTGRFITRDSYRGERENADTWHLYAYCMNNPINRIDPSGHDAIVLKSNFLTRAIGHMAVLIKKAVTGDIFPGIQQDIRIKKNRKDSQ